MIYEKVEKGPISQGDILYPVKVKDYLPWWPTENSLPVVIVTPICDIVNNRADHHTFLILQPIQYLFYNLCSQFGVEIRDGKGIFSKAKSTSIKDKLKNAMKNSWPRYHSCPKEEDVFKTNYIIDFQTIATVPINIFDEEIRIARFVSPFKEELIHRFSHHVMRIGTPDLPGQQIDASIQDCFKTLGI